MRLHENRFFPPNEIIQILAIHDFLQIYEKTFAVVIFPLFASAKPGSGRIRPWFRKKIGTLSEVSFALYIC